MNTLLKPLAIAALLIATTFTALRPAQTAFGGGQWACLKSKEFIVVQVDPLPETADDVLGPMTEQWKQFVIDSYDGKKLPDKLTIIIDRKTRKVTANGERCPEGGAR
jgi:hypothetical protein